MAKAYFRGDARPPSEIFDSGFTPREDYSDAKVDEPQWWQYACKLDGYPYVYETALRQKASTDADCESGVSVSMKFESAAIFPLNPKSDVYIYVIALPDPCRIITSPVENGYEHKLEINSDTPVDVKRRVVDLHSMQTEQTGKIISSELEGKEEYNPDMGRYSGWSLYSYECVAHTIPRENIICAIKYVPGDVDNIITVNPYESKEVVTDISAPCRKFTLEGEIIWNKHFKPTETIEAGTSGSKTKISYSEIRNDVEKQIYSLISRQKEGDTLETPDVHYGLGGKTF